MSDTPPRIDVAPSGGSDTAASRRLRGSAIDPGLPPDSFTDVIDRPPRCAATTGAACLKDRLDATCAFRRA